MSGSSVPDLLLDALVEEVGAAHVLTDPDLVAPYAQDWTRRWRGAALAVVRPASTAETAGVVSACFRARVPVIPQGGNSGLVGGSVPGREPGALGPPVILSTRRLTRRDPVDGMAGQVTVGAGVSLGDVQRHAAAAGWEYGVDLAARDTATIGGTVATNAGGIRVIAHGMTRAQVAGIEAVLPDGRIVEHLSGLAKDNTGYDIAGLLTGSEGTLGVITAVRLRLHRPHRPSSVALVGATSYDEALDLMHAAVHPGVTLLAAEVIDETGMQLASAVSGLPWPLEHAHPLVLLLEVADGGQGEGFDADVLGDRDVVLGLDAAERTRLWSFRELQSEAFSSLATRESGGAAHKLDVSVPLRRLAACADELRRRMEDYPGVVAFGVFGHLGDGNIHVEIVGPDADDEQVDRLVLEAVAAEGGSISAEHGIGRAKAHLLGLSRSPEEIAAMRAIKDAWDPGGLMNPGALFP
ncbi:MAG: FAD-binding oxidoreductase [bacterium]